MNSKLMRLSFVTVALILAALIVGPASVRADEFNLKTFITVNQPFQVPGAVLQPNVKYVFRRMNENAGENHVIRVFNEDQTKVISTFFAASSWRLEPADNTVLTFYETAAGYPKPVKTWFYPGRLNGYEFLYSKAEQDQIAMHMGGAAPEVQTAETGPAPVVTPPATEETTLAPTQPVQEETVTTPEQTAQPEVEREKPSEAAQATPAPMEEHKELPKTAGELPLFALLGVAGLSLRMALRKL